MGRRPIGWSGRPWARDRLPRHWTWENAKGDGCRTVAFRTFGPSAMSRHAFRVLELETALERVASRATSEVGRERILALRPVADTELLLDELAAVQETVAFLDEDRRTALPEIPDARAALRTLVLEGSVLEPGQLHLLASLLTAGRVLREVLREDRDRFPRLWARCRDAHADRGREDALSRTVDATGQILDTATPELRRIRTELARAHTRIVRRLEAFAGSLGERIAVADASVTVRNGRYVVPVRREGRREVGGIVHDESSSGATLFIEPPLAIQLMNDLKELERAEEREIRRILIEHTDGLRPSAPALAASQDALAAFDGLVARARAATDWKGAAPELVADASQGLRIVEGRHPLLLGRTGRQVVPFHLELSPGETAMVVSGPNTGGKTVLLKAVGLIAALAQCGVIPPVARGTRLPVFRRFFADIGDEQSIDQSLSTFSAHLANLKEILGEADDRSLVLVDEMGTGTDPAEGAALARAILEVLVRRRALTLVTSHLGALKRLDTEDSGIVNASLEFDPDLMEPTYVLVKGRPGRSYGLAIARRLGLPADVLDLAEEHLSEGEARLDDLLERLQRAERDASALGRSLAEEREETERRTARLEVREQELVRREKSADERARDEARRMLLDARSEVEAAIREVREAGAEVQDEAEHSARRRVEEAAARHRTAPVASGAEATRGSSEIAAGDRVRIRSSGTRGEVLEVRDDRALVSASGVRLQVAVSELEPVAASERERRPQGGGWTGPEAPASIEADLRGLRVDEVETVLARALDGAILQDLTDLRIIHGKGSGALRKRVHELLEYESRVASFRLGGPGEGGAGVTVATLR